MFFRRGWVVLALLPALWALYIWGIPNVGVLSADEPRYAAVGRAMARSGDWITPRLWGEPWFEKPALLYWLVGAAYRLGLSDDWAPRLPVALLSIAFLAFYLWWLRREFGGRTAAYATALLGTSAGWVVYSQLSLTDAPLTVFFSASLLLALPWLARGDRRTLPYAGACLGFATLAKGLVPLVLVLPVLWFGRRRWRDLGWAAVVFLLVAIPWYALCTERNGAAFLVDFFGKHHFARFAGNTIHHPQPFWFYVPVILGLLYPWSFGVFLLPRRDWWTDDTLRVLLVTVLFGFLFFSTSTNKLPGYILPLLPSLSLLLAAGYAKRGSVAWLAISVLLLGALPAVARILPVAILEGLRHTRWSLSIVDLLPAALAALICAWLVKQQRLGAALTFASLLTVTEVVWLKSTSYPILDRVVSARQHWRDVVQSRQTPCIDPGQRGWEYGMEFYADRILPPCESKR